MFETQKAIYIAGLGHSGSTVLDLLLATGGKAVSLGQIWNVLGEDSCKTRARICTCGSSAADCGFWGPILDRLESSRGTLSPGEKYRFVLARAKDLFGPHMAIVDSSKEVSNVATLAKEVPELKLLVLHNIKDVRAFTTSMIDNSLRKHNRRPSPERLFLEWYRTNHSVHSKVSQVLGRPPLRVMYEALCFATQAVAERVTELLGEQYIDPDAPLKSGLTHIISGNRFRLSDSKEATSLTYDCRWFGRSEWLRPYFLMPFVRKYNETCHREWQPHQALAPGIGAEPVSTLASRSLDRFFKS